MRNTCAGIPQLERIFMDIKPQNHSPEIKKQPMTKEDLKKKLKIDQQKDKEPVKGIFRFFEVPGGSLNFIYGPMYKGDQSERYDLVDNQMCTLPLGVAKHLNKKGWYPAYGYQKDEQGNVVMRVSQKVRRFGFQSLEFLDLDDLSAVGSPLVTATPLVHDIDQVFQTPQV